MTPWEAKEYRKGVIETALLRDHVRKLLLAGEVFTLTWYIDWRNEAIRLFDAKHWWDKDLQNAVPIPAHPLNNPLNQQGLELPPQDSVSTNSTTSAVDTDQEVV